MRLSPDSMLLSPRNDVRDIVFLINSSPECEPQTVPKVSTHLFVQKLVFNQFNDIGRIFKSASKSPHVLNDQFSLLVC